MNERTKHGSQHKAMNSETGNGLEVPGEVLASLVRHELRGPLNALSGWLHLLAARPPVADDLAQRAQAGARRAIEEQIAQIDCLGAVIGLLMSAGTLAREPVAVSAVLHDCERLLQREADESGHASLFRMDPSGAAGLMIEANRPALVDALTALVRHASQRAVSAVGVRILSSAPGSDSIQGTGLGLLLSLEDAPPTVGSIWQPLDSAGSVQSLALLHARLVILAHGGSFSVQATAGQALTVRLPLLVSELGAPAGSLVQGGESS
jgi:hypothetical protein